MLRWRLLGALVTIVPLVLILWLEDRDLVGHPGIILVPVGLFAAIGASVELTGMMRKQVPTLSTFRIALAVGVALGIASAPVAWRHYPANCPVGSLGWYAIAMSVVLCLLFLDEMSRFRQPGDATMRIALGLFAIVYTTMPLVFLLHMRRLESGREGILLIVSVVWIVKLSDAGAYFVGRFLGRHKMAPVLSPKKTWEGALGAAVAGGAGAVAFMYGVAPLLGCDRLGDGPLAETLGYGVALVVAGIVGDLSESLLKRDLQTKDSASWLPGLGGLLDVLDSLSFAAPIAYLWWAVKII